MRTKIIAAVGVVVSWGPLLITGAKRLADGYAIIHIPHDTQELIMALSHYETYVSLGGFLLGCFCVVYLVLDISGPRCHMG